MPTNHEASYRKSIALASLAALAAASVGVLLDRLPAPAGPLLEGLAAVSALVASVVALGGLVVVSRARHFAAGGRELFLAANDPRREPALGAADGFRAAALRRLAARMMLGHDLLVGDAVEIRTLPEILATLDEHGCVDGIPFQTEMAAYCGRRGQVFRCLDKIYDFGRTRHMRRLNGFVLVGGLRCDGGGHGGCEARCYLIWSTKWLRRADAGVQGAPVHRASGRAPAPALSSASTAAAPRYQCQFTQLHAASKDLPRWGIGKELRPLVSGNFTIHAWLIALLTRAFNMAQRARGGVGYPVMPDRPEVGEEVASEPLAAGDVVIVKPIEEIARTLNRRNKNRGLWFDQDMIKHCGTRRTVLARIDRIIDDATGEMRAMKTPCIMLEANDYSGEFLNFNAQHDPFFWREAWLHKTDRR